MIPDGELLAPADSSAALSRCQAALHRLDCILRGAGAALLDAEASRALAEARAAATTSGDLSPARAAHATARLARCVARLLRSASEGERCADPTLPRALVELRVLLTRRLRETSRIDADGGFAGAGRDACAALDELLAVYAEPERRCSRSGVVEAAAVAAAYAVACAGLATLVEEDWNAPRRMRSVALRGVAQRWRDAVAVDG